MEHCSWRFEASVFRAITVFGEAPRGSLRIPAEFWTSLIPGQEVFIQVLAIGPDGAVTGRSTLREIRRTE